MKYDVIGSVHVIYRHQMTRGIGYFIATGYTCNNGIAGSPPRTTCLIGISHRCDADVDDVPRGVVA